MKMSHFSSIDFNASEMFYELDFLAGDCELVKAAQDLIRAQKHAAGFKVQNALFSAPEAQQAVSEEALRQITARGGDIDGINTKRSITIYSGARRRSFKCQCM
jgi:hypothetical protein